VAAHSEREPLLTFVHKEAGADVLVVTNLWPETDRPVYGIFVQRQVDSLRAAGIRCDVLYVRGYRSALAYPLAALRFTLSSFTWRRRYRLIHVHSGETALAARFHLGTPIVVSYCGDDILGNPRDNGTVPLMSRVRAGLVRAHSQLFPATITKSREMHERLPASTRRRNTVVPNGVDATRFKPIDRDECRLQLGWAPGEFIALFASTRPDSPRKRRDLAERACAEAARSSGTVRLHVAGSVPPDEMPVLMNAADCLLVTSSIEGSPNVVKEALMCNLPVVATATGDVRERLEGVEPSWVCAPSVDDLAGALRECAASRRRSDGRERSSELEQKVVANRIIQLYERVARRYAEAPG
jgi:glycosyltransferase involved in cell wall biosynthesis